MKNYKLENSHSYEEIDAAPAPAAAQSAFRPPALALLPALAFAGIVASLAWDRMIRRTGRAIAAATLAAATLAAACLLLSGCMSDKQWEDTAKMHGNYIAQARTYDAVALRGANMTVTISGATDLVMQAPLNPLTTIPQAPDVLKDAVDGAKTVAGYVALGYVGAKAVDGLKGASTTTTINNAAPAAQ